MKKVIALCLVFALVLSVASLCLAGNVRCNLCGTYNAILVGITSYSPNNNSVHNVTTTYYTYCSKCNGRNTVGSASTTESHSSLSHYHQWLTPHLYYEYDICGVCHGKINEKTTYVN